MISENKQNGVCNSQILNSNNLNTETKWTSVVENRRLYSSESSEYPEKIRIYIKLDHFKENNNSKVRWPKFLALSSLIENIILRKHFQNKYCLLSRLHWDSYLFKTSNQTQISWEWKCFEFTNNIPFRLTLIYLYSK